MIHLPELISDLGFILITAAAVTLIFRYLRQPVVLGYIIAGLLVGPHVPFIPTVTELESIRIWAEIGVIFLLFGLGLEFSFKKLARVGKTASITAGVEVLFMLGLGFLAGQIFGWSQMDSLFLGGILAISSTTIIVRAFEELGLKNKKFVSVVFGVLVVEDLFAILLLVLLSTVAVTQTLSGIELIASTLRLGFFLILWFLVGMYALPVFLKKIRIFLNNETTLVVALGLCLTMVMIATYLGFSPALGAFIMGSLLAETREGKRIEHLIIPLRDLFGAIFFVSVGMLIDPQTIIAHWWIILMVTVLTIVGKFLSSSLGALLSGQNLKTSVQAGMSLAQIGEFSFIIATLGLTLGVISDFIYPVAVSVSVITTFTTPYMIKYSAPFYKKIESITPALFFSQLERYRASLEIKKDTGIFSALWTAYGIKISLNSVLIIAITLGLSKWMLPYLETQIGSGTLTQLLTGFAALLISSPFFWAILFSGSSGLSTINEDLRRQLNGLQFGIILFRGLVSILLIGFIISQFSSILAISGLLLLLVALILVFLSRLMEPLYQSVENDFVTNLNAIDVDEDSKVLSELAPWDATLNELVISPHSSLIAKTLEQAALKEKFGVTIALIERGQRRILAPQRAELLLPYDRLFLIGTEEQLDAIKPFIEDPGTTFNVSNEDFGLESLLLTPSSPFTEKPIRECGIREAVHGLIVGVERSGKRILNPHSSLILEPGDLIWLVGNRELIRKLA